MKLKVFLIVGMFQVLSAMNKNEISIAVPPQQPVMSNAIQRTSFERLKDCCSCSDTCRDCFCGGCLTTASTFAGWIYGKVLQNKICTQFWTNYSYKQHLVDTCRTQNCPELIYQASLLMHEEYNRCVQNNAVPAMYAYGVGLSAAGIAGAYCVCKSLYRKKKTE